MLKVESWCALQGDYEWTPHELDLPADTRDPVVINRCLSDMLGEDPDEPTWSVAKALGEEPSPILLIECRSERNHMALILVKYPQED